MISNGTGNPAISKEVPHTLSSTRSTYFVNVSSQLPCIVYLYLSVLLPERSDPTLSDPYTFGTSQLTKLLRTNRKTESSNRIQRLADTLLLFVRRLRIVEDVVKQTLDVALTDRA